MGIIQRFADIMSSNINALLDRAEDPEKMIDQCLRNLESDLGKVKAETASVMADAERARREVEECQAEIDKMQEYAKRAVTAGNDEDAKKFLTQKAKLTEKLTNLQQTYDIAKANADKMRQMHDKLTNDIADLNSRRDAIKAKVKVAKTQEKINKMTSGVKDSAANMAAFDRMEAKANKMLDEANAMAQLNLSSADENLEETMGKYDTASSTEIDDELAALKAELGK